MIRRIFAAGLLAALVVLVPTAASAGPYGGDDPSIVCDSTVVVGQPVECTVEGSGQEAALFVEYGDEVSDEDIDVAGVKELRKSLGSGEASFSLTSNVATTLTASAEVDGEPIGTVSIRVAATGDALAGTGFEGLPIALGAALLLGAGAVMLMASRRTRFGMDVPAHA